MGNKKGERDEMWSGLGLMFVFIGVGLAFGLTLAIPVHGVCLFNCTINIQDKANAD